MGQIKKSQNPCQECYYSINSKIENGNYLNHCCASSSTGDRFNITKCELFTSFKEYAIIEARFSLADYESYMESLRLLTKSYLSNMFNKTYHGSIPYNLNKLDKTVKKLLQFSITNKIDIKNKKQLDDIGEIESKKWEHFRNIRETDNLHHYLRGGLIEQ